MSNLSRRVNERDLEKKFRKCGKVMHHKIVMDPILKESRGFGFVTFESKEDADDAVKEMNDYEMDGKRIIVEIARRSKPRKPTPGKYLGYDRSRDTYRSRRRGGSR